MKYSKSFITAALIIATYSGFASAMLAPTVNIDSPLQFNMGEALSEVRPELNCSANANTGKIQCDRPEFIYTCQVAKKPNLMIYYYSSITTLGDFNKVSSQKGLANCVAGASW